MDRFIDNLRAGLALACGRPVDRGRFRVGPDQLAALAVAVAGLVAVLRLLAAPEPSAEAATEMASGPGPIVLLGIGAVGCVFLVDRIQKAEVGRGELLVVVLSSEVAALVIAAAARQIVIRFPSEAAAGALTMLPWLVLAWMVLIVVRAASILAKPPE